METSEIDVMSAGNRLRGKVRRTPIFAVLLGGKEMILKLEHLQIGGSFKYRGALNALLGLPMSVSEVVTASGGNHGLAVALAAVATGRRSDVVIPETTPQDKVDRVRAVGANVIIHGSEYAEAERHALDIAKNGKAFIHPFADPAVISGQGTLGLEIVEQVDGDGDCDAVVVAVGGGGLLAGVAHALHDSAVRVVGVEPEGIPTMQAALDARRPIDVDVQSIAASSLGARRTEWTNLNVVMESAADVVLVSDDDITNARSLLWDECRIAVEAGAAVGLASVLAGKVEAERPCVVLCGANSGWSYQ